jgi:hypothetical protein
MQNTLVPRFSQELGFKPPSESENSHIMTVIQKINVLVFSVFFYRNIVIRPASIFFELLDQHVFGIEELFEMSNNIDVPIHWGSE